MEIILNNQQKTFLNHNSLTVQELLDIVMPEKQKGIAVAIANNVVPKNQWNNTSLKQHDEVMIIKATQGG